MLINSNKCIFLGQIATFKEDKNIVYNFHYFIFILINIRHVTYDYIFFFKFDNYLYC